MLRVTITAECNRIMLYQRRLPRHVQETARSAATSVCYMVSARANVERYESIVKCAGNSDDITGIIRCHGTRHCASLLHHYHAYETARYYRYVVR